MLRWFLRAFVSRVAGRRIALALTAFGFLRARRRRRQQDLRSR